MLLLDLAQVAQDRPFVAFAIVGLLLALVFKAAPSELKHPESLPWIGRDNTKSFAVTRATWSSVSNAKKWLAEGYQKVRSHRHSIGEPSLNVNCNSIRKRANLTSFRISLDGTKSSFPTTSSSGSLISLTMLQAFVQRTMKSCKETTPLLCPVSTLDVICSSVVTQWRQRGLSHKT